MDMNTWKGNRLPSMIDYGTIPKEPMDIYGELVRLLSVSRGDTESRFSMEQFETTMGYARTALVSSALIINPAVNGIQNAYMDRDDYPLISDIDKELAIRNGVISTIREKIKMHLKKQNERTIEREQPYMNKKLIAKYIRSWKAGENVANMQEYATLRDLGIMFRQRRQIPTT